ncbi:MAG: Zn-ribbon domain-containing OB-fold protein [Candidatus Binatia bacterium]
MTLHPDYPLPDTADPIMAPFWSGCCDHKLILQRERAGGAVHWPPKPAYWKGGALEYFEASGRGEVYTYVIGSEPFLPAFAHMLPHIMVVVQLAEGPRLVGYMVNCTPDRMRFGLPVNVVYRQLTDDVTLPVWEPA